MNKKLRKILPINLLLIGLTLSSCNSSVYKTSDENMNNLIRSIETDDEYDVIDFMSSNVRTSISNLADLLNELCEIYNGTTTKIERTELYYSIMNSSGESFESHEMFYDVTTTEGFYYFSIYWTVKDDLDQNNIGIYSLIFQKHEYGEERKDVGEWFKGVLII